MNNYDLRFESLWVRWVDAELHALSRLRQSIRRWYCTVCSKNVWLKLIFVSQGHVDFSYEVSRSLAACQGVLLVVDGQQVNWYCFLHHLPFISGRSSSNCRQLFVSFRGWPYSYTSDKQSEFRGYSLFQITWITKVSLEFQKTFYMNHSRSTCSWS